MYKSSLQKDTHVKINLRDGLTGFQSDSVDVVIEQAANFPLTLILFYDQEIYCNSIMRNLAVKLLDVFIFKFEKNLLMAEFKNFSPQNVNYF